MEWFETPDPRSYISFDKEFENIHKLMPFLLFVKVFE